MTAILQYQFSEEPDAETLYSQESFGNWIHENLSNAELVQVSSYLGHVDFPTNYEGDRGFFLFLVFGPIDQMWINDWQHHKQEIVDYVTSELEPSVIKLRDYKTSADCQNVIAAHGNVVEEGFVDYLTHGLRMFL